MMLRNLFFFIAILLPVITAHAQTATTCGSFWVKADYKDIDQASAFKSRALLQLPDKAHDTVIAKTYNTLGIYMNFAGKQDSALVYFEKAQHYLNNYPKLKTYTYLNQAAAYEATANYKKSLAAGTAALQLATITNNRLAQALANQAIAMVYFRTDEIGKSIQYLLKGIAILQKQNTNCYLYLLKLSLANTYIQTNNYIFASKLFEEFLQHNTHLKGTKLHTIAIVNYTECLIELQNYNRAYDLLTGAVPSVQKAGDRELEAVLYYRLGKLQDRRSQLTSSLNYYNKAYALLSPINSKYSTHIFSDYLELLNRNKKYAEALKLATSFNTTSAYRIGTPLERMEYEKALAETAEKTGDLNVSNAALKEALKLSDSIRQVTNGRAENEMQAKYQTTFQSKKNTLLAKHNTTLEKKLKVEELLIWMYVTGSTALIVVVLLYLRGYKLRNRLNKQKLKTMEADKNLIEQQHLFEQEVTKNNKLIIDEKQREATSMALRMATYYDNINILLEKFNTPGYTTLSDIKHELQQLAKQKDYWKQFETRFNNLNPEFSNTLTTNFSKLTKNDIEFCTLLKLKLSNKEIASLLQISHESVITKKYRIRKKMGIQDEAELEMMLSQI